MLFPRPFGTGRTLGPGEWVRGALRLVAAHRPSLDAVLAALLTHLLPGRLAWRPRRRLRRGAAEGLERRPAAAHLPPRSGWLSGHGTPTLLALAVLGTFTLHGPPAASAPARDDPASLPSLVTDEQTADGPGAPATTPPPSPASPTSALAPSATTPAPVATAVVPALPFLPAWVKPVKPAPLWSDPTSEQAPLQTVPSGKTLRVLGAERSRLEVEYAAGRGWIDVLEVQPEPEAGRWFRSQGQLALRSSPAAEVSQTLPGSLLLRVEAEGPQPDHAQVQAYDEAGHAVGEGWTVMSLLQPIDPPAWAIKPYPPTVANLDKLLDSRQTFIEQVGAAARQSSASSGLPPSITVAQAILESDWGRSQLSRLANNYFGIKARTQIGPAGLVWMPTWEVINGQDVTVLDVFRAYHNIRESIEDHDRFLRTQPRYRAALQVTDDPVEFITRVWKAGYSTDPRYVDKIVNLMNTHNLWRFEPA